MEKESFATKFTRILPISDLITYAMVVAAFVIVTVMNGAGMLSYQMRSLLVPCCYSIMLALSLNLVVGFLGELSLGHAGFMSVGAYSGCLVALAISESAPGISPALRLPIALIVGGLVAAVFGIIIGVPILRLNGDYLAIVTLAFGEIIKGIIPKLSFTGGSLGLHTSSIQDADFTIGFILVMITLFVILNIKRSKVGRAIMAIRDNRIAAQATGINVTYYKLLVFVLSAFFAGMAGVLYGHNVSIVQPITFDFNYSINILVFVVLGGMGSIRGSIIAATILTILPVKLSFLDGGYKTLIYALVLIFMMLLTNWDRFKTFRAVLTLNRQNRKRRKEGAVK